MLKREQASALLAKRKRNESENMKEYVAKIDGGEGVEIASREGEFSTFKIILMDGGEAYLMHPNGGSRGSWDRRGGDGVWRDYPVSPTERVTREKARELMLDWGYDPSAVARATRAIV